VTRKRALGLVALLVLLLTGGVASFRHTRERVADAPAAPARIEPDAAAAPAIAQRPRPRDEPVDTTSGLVDGSVLDAVTRRGVPHAELTFSDSASASTFHTGEDGSFLLAPAATGALTLATITAPGYLAYVSGPGRATARVTLAPGPPVHGVTLLLAPAVDRAGLVIDAYGAPVAGARVRVVGVPASDLVADAVAVWTTARDGTFTFQAAEDAALEASHGSSRSVVSVDWFTSAHQRVVIQLGRATPLDAMITGHVRDPSGAPLADAVVRAAPSIRSLIAPTVFATSDADGAFSLVGVDHAAYDVTAELDERLPGTRMNVLGGSRNLDLVLEAGQVLAGRVVDLRGAPVPAFTVVARWRFGVAHAVAARTSAIDPHGQFTLRVRPGDYDVIALARGCAHSPVTRASSGASELRLVVGGATTLRGRVVASDDDAAIGGATVECEVAGLAGFAVPGEPPPTTAPDGTFELTDISLGPLEIRISAAGYHSRLESSLTARAGEALGPLTVELNRASPDRPPGTEQVGIGVRLDPERDALRVTWVDIAGSAFDAGILFGDLLRAIDGVPVSQLGLDGAMTQLRGVAGTTAILTIRRGDADVRVAVVRRRLLR